MEVCSKESLEAVDNPPSVLVDDVRKAVGEIVRVPEPIKRFAEERGMSVRQVNSQRIFGPERIYIQSEDGGEEYNWMPSKGSEVFVGKLPRTCYETEIVPHFEQCGNIFQLRLMMDFSGTNKGFCFVKFFTPEQANKAVKLLNKSEIREGCPIAVAKSVDNCKLIIRGIPMSKPENDIFTEISKLTEGVVEVLADWQQVHTALKSQPQRRGREEVAKGFVTVVYESHRAAATARSQLLRVNVELWGCKISVDWAEPEISQLRDYWFYKMPQVLSICKMPKSLRNIRQLTKLCNEFSNNGVQEVRFLSKRGVVFFKTRAHAEMAKVSLDGRLVDGKRIFIEWFDPYLLTLYSQNYTKAQRRRFLRKQKLRQNKFSANRGGPNNIQITEVMETALMPTTPIANNIFVFPPSPPAVMDLVYHPIPGIQEVGPLPFTFYHPTNAMVPVIEAPVSPLPPVMDPVYPPIPGIQEIGPLPFTFYHPTNVMVPVVETPVSPPPPVMNPVYPPLPFTFYGTTNNGMVQVVDPLPPFVPVLYSFPYSYPECQMFVSFQNLRLD